MPRDRDAVVDMDTELWLVLRDLVNKHEGAMVAARVVAVAAQLCARTGIPADIALQSFVAAMVVERQVMLDEAN